MLETTILHLIATNKTFPMHFNDSEFTLKGYSQEKKENNGLNNYDDSNEQNMMTYDDRTI